MGATFLVGDVRARMAELEDGSFDLILCSPPFLALRSYLPDGHPDKHLEIGSEATPAEFLDTMLELTAEWGRLLAPHGSIAIELGDTYAGSGGGGGDYLPGGLREDQPGFGGSAELAREGNAAHWRAKNRDPDAWPLAKSLVCIPQLYQVALAYGINPLTGQESPAGRWRVRNLKAWIRSNPPVGALGDKERPATSYIIVACRAADRWFDLDAVRTTPNPAGVRPTQARVNGNDINDHRDQLGPYDPATAGGAPPRDWTHTIDLILDTELAARAGKRQTGGLGNDKNGAAAYPGGGGDVGTSHNARGSESTGAQGVHLRRALEHAGILHPQDFYDISPKGYSGAHYAVWPPELARRLIDEMCPRHVCLMCGEPSRRIVDTQRLLDGEPTHTPTVPRRSGQPVHGIDNNRVTSDRTTVGWSDCGHNQYRPGRVLDPFVGSGTTLAVASGMARDSVGIDLDARNATLAYQRVGMFLTVDGDMDEPDLTPTPATALEPVVDVVESL